MTPDQYHQIRINLGLTQAELAKALGVSRDTVMRREGGQTPITAEQAAAIRLMAAKADSRRK
jgi:DNA-binding XRE family transcriptional regulator